MSDEGFLKITEVAGTSAGSIAAVCLAHPSPNPELIQKIVRLSGDNIQSFQLPSTKFGIFKKLAFGGALLDERNLENIIRSFFSIGDRAMLFKDAVYPLRICAADIKRSKPVIFHKENSKPLEEAVTDSCSIPFVFRSYGNGSYLADGGVMANLLDQSVFADASAHTLAFSFQNGSEKQYDGLLSFSRSIVESMIDNAVNEAKIRILNSGGYVCELPSLFGTLNFADALISLKDDAFREEVVDKCKTRIRSGLEDFHNKSSLLAHGDRMAQMQNFIGTTFDAIKRRDPYRVINGVIACKANCLFNLPDGRSKNPDIQIKRVEIEPTGGSIQFFRIGISKGSDPRLTNEISCRVYDSSERLLPATFEVSSSFEDGVSVHRLCVILDDVHLSECGPITVSMMTTHQKGLMEDLKSVGRTEWMRSEAHRDDEIEVQDFVLILPKSFPNLNLSDLRNNLHRCHAPPDDLSASELNWEVGRSMTHDELEEHQTWLRSEPGFRYVGWRVRNVKGRCSCGVLIEQDIGV
ncbi:MULTISPECIES: patatin-like phospholipase family protein [unclassified Marinovum]